MRSASPALITGLLWPGIQKLELLDRHLGELRRELHVDVPLDRDRLEVGLVRDVGDLQAVARGIRR